MRRMTTALIIPLVPAVLLGILFPEALFNLTAHLLSPSAAASAALPSFKQEISAQGPVALYFALVTLMIWFTRVNKLDAFSPLRARISGHWKFSIQQHDVRGSCDIRVDKRSQRLFIAGSWGEGDSTEYWNVEPGQIALSDHEIVFIASQHRMRGDRRAVVELALPGSERINEMQGALYQINGGGFASLIANRDRRFYSLVASGKAVWIYAAAIVLLSVLMIARYYGWRLPS